MRGGPQGPTIGIRIFRVAYWTAVVALGLGLAWILPSKHREVAFNQMTYIFYAVGAAAIYRLLLLFAFHAGGGDGVEREIRESEGRVELKLDDRDDGWGP
jgi:hypothetical protein